MKSDKVFTIAAHEDFLEILAQSILDGRICEDWSREGAFWLADFTIFLPTRRSRTTLANIFVRLLGDQPMLLPDIRALGGEDPTEEPFLPPYEPMALPPAMSGLKRRLLLAQLVEKWLETRPAPVLSGAGFEMIKAGELGKVNAAEVLALADSLGVVLDDFLIAQIEPKDLFAISDEQLPAQWQDNLEFVRFIFELWPNVLQAEGEIARAERTNILLEQQRQALKILHKDKPVVVAGSTGSMPATAALIKEISHLPRGAVVLPGFDTSMTTQQIETFRDNRKNPHGHPQYGLAKLIGSLGLPASAINELSMRDAPRTRLLNAALSLPEDTAHWREAIEALGDEGIAQATDGMSICLARNPHEEARAVAVAVRQGLAQGETIAIIVPDQMLARKISAELMRYDIAVDDAAGVPLARSRAGRLVRQVVTLFNNKLSAVDVMALLRNRYVQLGLGRQIVSLGAQALDFGVLRGQRPAPGLDGLRAGVAANLSKDMSRTAYRLNADQALSINEVLDAVQLALEPVSQLFNAKSFQANQFAMAIAETIRRLTRAPEGERPVTLEGGAELETWAGHLTAQGERGPKFDKYSIPLALTGLLTGANVRPKGQRPEDVVLFGRLEARMMRADTVILAGLVEGSWPEIADPGPWMSRGMRMAAGLEPPEKLQGLAAHDFLMAAGAPRVMLSLAQRSGTSPSNPSRLVQRLEAFIGEDATAVLRKRGEVWIALASELDLAGHAPVPEDRPAPQPPKSVRPRRLSITEVETLFRSPYDLYAKHVLKLYSVAALGADPDAAERGTIIHDIFGEFIQEGNDPMDANAIEVMKEIALRRFASLEAIPERRDIWLRRFLHAAGLFLEFERDRNEVVRDRRAEIGGDWAFQISGEDFKLVGRADRIDVMKNGKNTIIDFKTGTVPTKGDMENYLAPQLPISAVMAANGAFLEAQTAPTSNLTYVKISNGPEGFKETAFTDDKNAISEIIDEVFTRFQSHVQALLLSDELPMLPRVFPKKGQMFKGAYEHLARTDEWTLTETDGEGDDE